MLSNQAILQKVFKTKNLDVYFCDKMIECMEMSRRDVLNDLEKKVIEKIRISEDRYYFWNEIYFPLLDKHLK